MGVDKPALRQYIEKKEGGFSFACNAVIAPPGSLLFCDNDMIQSPNGCRVHLKNTSGYDSIREYVRLSGKEAREYISEHERNPELPSYINLYGSIDDILTVRTPTFSDKFLYYGKVCELYGKSRIEDTMAGLVKESFGVSLPSNINSIAWYIIPDLLYGRYMQPKADEAAKKDADQEKEYVDLRFMVLPGKSIRQKSKIIEIPPINVPSIEIPIPLQETVH